MNREHRFNFADSFTVFDKINNIYPTKYKYIVRKFDNSITFCVILYNKNTGSNDNPIILTCDPENILNSNTLPYAYYYSRCFATIDNYLFFIASTGGYDNRCEIYTKDTLQLVGTSTSMGNWLTGSPFCTVINNKHYFAVVSNKRCNCPSIICGEDMSISRIEVTGVHLYNCFVKYDAVNNVYYDIRYSGSTSLKHDVALYADSNFFSQKTYSNPISNVLPISGFQDWCKVLSFPTFSYKPGDLLKTYVITLIDGGMGELMINNQMNSIAIGSRYQHGTNYDLSYGFLINNNDIYTMDISSKNIQKTELIQL